MSHFLVFAAATPIPITLVCPNTPQHGEGLLAYAMSPGFGGAAAVVAALIALGAARLQAKTLRDIEDLKHAREIEQKGADQQRERKSVTRDFAGYLSTVLRWAEAFAVPNPNDANLEEAVLFGKGTLRAFAKRSKEPDVARTFNDDELYAIRVATAGAEAISTVLTKEMLNWAALGEFSAVVQDALALISPDHKTIVGLEAERARRNQSRPSPDNPPT